jgi:hypothetical protein
LPLTAQEALAFIENAKGEPLTVEIVNELGNLRATQRQTRSNEEGRRSPDALPTVRPEGLLRGRGSRHAFCLMPKTVVHLHRATPARDSPGTDSGLVRFGFGQDGGRRHVKVA